jgi:kynureninase
MRQSSLDLAHDTATARDAADALAPLRQEFHIPEGPDGWPERYLSGHSLGLMPRGARALVERELERWAREGVAAHFDDDGWLAYHERFAAPLARLLNADPAEVVAMNSLSVNLHLLLASFFEPRGERCRIVIESGAFPSDRYAVASQLRWHGLDPARDLLELGARTEDGAGDGDNGMAESLDALLEAQANRVALVLLPGVQYLSGAAPDLAACAAVARRHGCRIGFDLAHAIGNLAIDLRASEPDFAVWCSYKYLNGGPGAIGGAFVNRRWIGNREIQRLEGWWGHDKARRFAGDAAFAPIASAEAWQLSNPPIFAMAPLEASLALFDRAGIANLRRKSIALTAFLEHTLERLAGDEFELTTPRAAAARGAQLSLRIRREPSRAGSIVAQLQAQGIVIDWRAPDTLRLAPVPLYNSFADVEAAATALAAFLRS